MSAVRREERSFERVPPSSLAELSGVSTGAACADDGVCYVVIRSFKPGYGNRAAILAVSPENEATTLAIFDAPLTLDNFEGLAVREQYGRRFLYVVSDDNFNNSYENEHADCQNTLLMKFEIKSEEPPAPQVADAPEPDPQYETVDVVLQTAMGDITIALEVERAPITAAITVATRLTCSDKATMPNNAASPANNSPIASANAVAKSSMA